ncbi:MAG: glucokinase, partial [Pseudomonadota bacterium]|nr:glucokinase [Pseudomonadota bacterium]
TRLALVENGRPGPVARYANAAFADFPGLLGAYVAHHAPGQVTQARIAVAGPVTGAQARLTNRDWVFRPDEIARALPGGGAQVQLVNDLVALGHALPALRKDQQSLLRAPQSDKGTNGQALVVGLGTGFNVCQVLTTPSGTYVLGAELGHASLPTTLKHTLANLLPDAGQGFATNEDLFSGRGLERLHAARTGRADTARNIVDSAAMDPETLSSVTIAASLLGQLTRELVFQYLPLGGIYFAGTVARGVLKSGARQAFLDAVTCDGPFADLVAQAPLNVITDDSAALTGLARMGSQQPVSVP